MSRVLTNLKTPPTGGGFGYGTLMKRMRYRVPRLSAVVLVVLVTVAVAYAAFQNVGAQTTTRMHSAGQNIAPAYEGWEQNSDGSFNLVFGYLNRNWEEAITIPVGPDNNIEPGGPDQGQPTHFLPRRNYFLFRIRVPQDFGDKELVWTLTRHGRTERAYATLRPGYFLNDDAMTATLGAVGDGVTNNEVSTQNTRPLLRVEGNPSRTVTVGEPLTLTAFAEDDGLPRPNPSPRWRGSPTDSAIGTLWSVAGLRVAWFVYRGEGDAVVFTPPQFKVYQDLRGGSPWSPGWTPPPVPPDNRWTTTGTFSEPGTYVLRCLAHDGAISAHHDVTVTVTVGGD